MAYMPFVGGAEIAIKEITDRLDHDFTCFTYRFDREWPKQERIGKIDVVRIGRGRLRPHDYYGQFFKKIFYAFQAWRVAEKHHREQRLDSIWAMMASYAGMAALFFKLRHPKLPLLLTLQEGDSESHILRRVGIFYPLWKMLFKKADRIQVISHYLADFARRHGATCPIDVVPNGVKIDQFKNMQIDKLISNEFPVIITTSRLVHKNGVDTLIQAAGELKTRYNLKFAVKILGSGPDEQKLKKMARDLKVENEVKFLGHVDPDEILAHLAKADIFVRAARSEGLGNSFLEAMAAGLPVIGTNVGGIPDFLKNNETGVFTEVADSKDLADKIKLLLDDNDLRYRLIKNGRELVLKDYSWDNIAHNMDNIFNSL